MTHLTPLYRTLRAARRLQPNIAAAGWRDLAFTQLLIEACSNHAAVLNNGAFLARVERLSALLDGRSSILTGAVTFLQKAEGAILNDISEFALNLRNDALLVGWAYQIWNEPERDASTWGVSKRDKQQPESLSIAAATQLFTDDYMAQFLLARSGNISGVDHDICDPACGTGHILVHAFRTLRRREPNVSSLELIQRLYGFDIDPYAVELCRLILLAEVMRDGDVDVGLLWSSLERTIKTVSAPLGSLDRNSKDALLERNYGCIVTNPPYLGRRKLTGEVREFLDREYPSCALDLCAAFMQRVLELLAPGGFLGLVTVDKWLRLKGYRMLRSGGPGFKGLYRELSLDTLCELGERAFDPRIGLHDGVGIALLTGRKLPPLAGHPFRFISCADLRDYEAKVTFIERLSKQPEAEDEHLRIVIQDKLLGESSHEIFLESAGLPNTLVTSTRQVKQVAQVVIGVQTNDDQRFVRYHWEVPPDLTRWKVHAKGGGYGRWYGLNRFVLDWQGGAQLFGADSKSGSSVVRWFDQPGWSYSWFANGSLGLRKKEAGWSFGRAASSGFFCEDERIVAFLNSRFGSLCVRRIGGKVQLPEGIVRNVPLPESLDGISLELIYAAVEIKQALVRTDPREVSFVPGVMPAPFDLLRLEVLLRLIEAALEEQVARCIGVRRGAEHNVMALPVGLYKTSYGVGSERFWSRIPARYAALRGVLCAELREGCSVTGSSGADLAALTNSLTTGKKRRVAGTLNPSDGPLEQLCREYSINPLDALLLLEEGSARDEALKQALWKPHVEVAIFERVLHQLGHIWWSQAEGSLRKVAGPRSVRELAELVSSELAGIEPEQILGMSVERWLMRKAPAWQHATFYGVPLLTYLVGDTSSADLVLHSWEHSDIATMSQSGLNGDKRASVQEHL